MYHNPENNVCSPGYIANATLVAAEGVEIHGLRNDVVKRVGQCSSGQTHLMVSDDHGHFEKFDGSGRSRSKKAGSGGGQRGQGTRLDMLNV